MGGKVTLEISGQFLLNTGGKKLEELPKDVF